MKPFEFHEVANLFPLMDGEEFASLVTDINANGLREPIWIHKDKIVDGRNRYRACLEAKVAPRFREWDGQGSLVMFVVSLNLHRRHLSSGQKAAIGLDVEELLAAEARKRQGARTDLGNITEIIPESEKGEARAQAAKVVGTNPRYVSDAKTLKQEAPDLLEKVRAGETTLPQAKRELKERRREVRREENRQKIAAVPSPVQAVEQGARFSTIVIDPPWDWGDEGDADQLGRARPTYQTMPFAEIAELPLRELADEDCHLYLWITNRSLPKGFELLQRWGFRYVTCLTWVKPHFGMGNYFRGQTEHVLFGVKGSQMLKRKDVGTVFHAPRGEGGHSSKPVEFYQLVESCSPSPYLEMFSRREREGWQSWGEDAERVAAA
jgi:N6-adenosine-specific RNA methylase IME4